MMVVSSILSEKSFLVPLFYIISESSICETTNGIVIKEYV